MGEKTFYLIIAGIAIIGILLVISNVKTFLGIAKKAVKEEVKKEMEANQKYEPHPGSDAHYVAWREEQRKKTGKE